MGLKNTGSIIFVSLLFIGGLFISLKPKASEVQMAEASTQGYRGVTPLASAPEVASTSTPSCMVTRNLSPGDKGPDVTALQKVLNMSPDTQIAASGGGSPGHEGAYFGWVTSRAVIRFQEKYRGDILDPQGFKHGTGMVSNATRAKLNQVCAQAELENIGTGGQNASSTQPTTGITKEHSTLEASSSISLSPQSVSSTIASSSTGTSSPTAPEPHGSEQTVSVPAPAAASVAPLNITQTASVAGSRFSSRTRNSKKTQPPPLPPPVTTPGTSTPPVTTPTTTPPIPPTPPVQTLGMKWGAFAGQSPTTVSTLDTQVGKASDFVAIFWAFEDGFPSQYNSQVGPKGKTLVVFWEPDFGYDTINNGSKDALMKDFATQAKAYGYPIIMAPFNEMNLNYEAWGYTINGNTAAKFKTAWQRMYSIFKDAGATNVKFALDYNETSVPDVSGNRFADYYPGDAYVDYIGIDGFNFGSPWLSFAQIFDGPIHALSTYNKPIYILSTASAAGSQKAKWITDMGATLKTYPLVKGWIWFNENKEQNWLINSDTASLAAFKAILP